MQPLVQTKTRRRLALLFTVPIFFSILFFVANTQAERTDVEILSAQNRKTALSTILSLTQDAETAEQGFLLTGDEQMLLPYEQANSQIKIQIELCRNLFRDSPSNPKDIEHLAQLVTQKFSEVDHALQVQKSGGFAAAVTAVKSGSPTSVMENIRRLWTGCNWTLAAS